MLNDAGHGATDELGRSCERATALDVQHIGSVDFRSELLITSSDLRENLTTFTGMWSGTPGCLTLAGGPL
ncbi:hypothetical protein HPB50_006904 [Hyalomma asiaticum]|uniref:Uncharacterized protein n=1 Tax=Hyalomma asiaticum TaxID=266040 RepID=A0ACB7RJN6_HYAAI|nr:hypothetical protein HPB50_006904 [Hyalomma asiaticum]